MSQPVTSSDYCTTQLVAATTNSQTTMLVSPPTSAFPVFDATHTYFYLTIVDQPSYAIDADPPAQREIVKVTAYASVSGGYLLTVVRAITTTAQIWAAGSIAEIRPCAQFLEDLKSAGGTDWLITDGITTVNAVEQLFVGATGGASVLVTDLGDGVAAFTVGATGGSISVTDGSTTVDPCTSVDFTSGATVSDLGGGVAGVAVSGSGGTSQSQEFTANGTFNVPSGVSLVWLTMVAAGGGGSAVSDAAQGGGGGGSGEYRESVPLFCTGGGTLAVTVGSAGSGAAGAGAGGTGGTSSVTNGTLTISAIGGGGGSNIGVGGTGGGVSGATAGNPGVAESPDGFSGTGGGTGGATTGTAGGRGGGNVGFPVGGAGGASASVQAGGGGGGNSPFGIGGTGGNGGANGSAPGAVAYGAGGGGAGGKAAAANGGAGKGGYVLVEWIG